MKWIRRFFRLQSEKEEKELHATPNTANELKTRVAYRYPQRNFRFPLDLEERIIDRRNEIRKEKDRLLNRSDRKEASHHTKETIQNDLSKPSTSSKEEVKRPFRPTEIPPPFYQREKQTDEPIVFELTPFFNDDNQEITINEEKSGATKQENETPAPVNFQEDSRPVYSHGVNKPLTEETNKERQTKETHAQQKTNGSLSNKLLKNSILLHQKVSKPYNAPTIQNKEQYPSYKIPPLYLLNKPIKHIANDDWLNNQKKILNNTFASFHVAAKVVGIAEGPRVTRFEVAPDAGVKVNKITNLENEMKLNLAAREMRIEAPIPGKHTIGIEIPNPDPRPVFLREILENRAYKKSPSPLTVALGLDIAGKPVIANIREMPHGLIAGATGSGKSVAINTIIVSLLYKARPDEVKLLLIDPKMVELSPYNDIPHLISPVITNTKAAANALKWAVDEMERRYEMFAKAGVRNIKKYNKRIAKEEKLPSIVIIIDELADLMMIAPNEVEEAIVRIAQKARACGIHLILATQRPSVDVITGLIKANIPTRMAFAVSSQVDSRTIIDTAGAERLLGMGDMLYLPNGSSKPIRLQGSFISDEEIEKVVHYVRTQGKPQYLFAEQELLDIGKNDEIDELFFPACEYAVEMGHISTSALQRKFRIGYNRAARLIEMMEEKGMISGQKGGKPRDVLLNKQELAMLKLNDV